ncbi:DUF2382 domain-containing protein [Rhodocytophaga rosea]|uniref:DUF2382 domain-containing protein n=1 Tax=Rhodocytophaga rosea TaxID=2704465 RepID=A0A6C0GTS8_9BACT|nr:DUF2382 domain-containing protein [Rhodocytophaga rosea]QHT71214.1 DUF2382 domain-containing protein [Rhodocytophaga rosea]
MSQTVIGIFENAGQAQQAVLHLMNNGFAQHDIDFSSQQDYTSSTDTSDQDNMSRRDFFRSLFDNEREAENYSRVASRGSVVTVHAHTEEQASQAASLLDQYGAVDVDEKSDQYSNEFNNQRESDASSTTNQSLPVIEENMQVGKRVVETGGVRLRSRIFEKPVEEKLRLRQEHVHVERHPADRPASEADINAFKEGVIEIREQAEVPVVSKQAQVVEEVSLSKEVEERTETIRDTLRNTEVEVENLSGKGREDVISSANTYTPTDTTYSEANRTYTDADGFHNESRGNENPDSDAGFLEKSHQDWQGSLRRMKEVEDDYKVSDEDPDVRGWDVIGRDGEKLGEVEELIVDTSAMKVRYLDVEIDDDLTVADEDDRHVLIPIGAVNLDHENKFVIAPNLTDQSITSIPAYHGEEISRDFEHKLISAFSPTYQPGSLSDERFYEGEHFNTNRLSGSGRV